MLAQLGDFTDPQVGPDEEHSYLPEEAMALIGEYQRTPQLAALGETGDDATSASYTELPASYKPPPRRRAQGAGSGPGWRRWLRAHLAWAGWASVGAALVVVGIILGAALSSNSPETPSTLAPPAGGAPAPPAGGPPPAPPTVCPESGQAGEPVLCMVNQSRGTVNTAWVVQGNGFVAQTSVTVSLIWNSPPQLPRETFDRTARVKPVTGRDGSLRLTISQLFPDSLRLGLFTVEVTGSDGRKALTTFIVIPPGA
jgi:hypothetical protein